MPGGSHRAKRLRVVYVVQFARPRELDARGIPGVDVVTTVFKEGFEAPVPVARIRRRRGLRAASGAEPNYG